MRAVRNHGPQALSRIARCKRLTALAMVLLSLGPTAFGQAERPHVPRRPGVDPIALLRGVEASRANVKSGKLLLECRYRTPDQNSVRTIEVSFDGSRRRFDVLSVTGPTSDLTRIAFDGTTATRFDGLSDAELSDLRATTSDLFFDPRLLGITNVYVWDQTIENALGYSNAKDVTLVGEEDVDKHRTWHVRVIDVYDAQNDFWIDESDDFLVRQSAYHTQFQYFSTTATYEDSGAFRRIPRVVQTLYRQNEKAGVFAERTIQVKESQLDVAIDHNIWTYDGMQLPVGTQVSDARIHRRIGYWDGFKLAERPPSVGRGASLNSGGTQQAGSRAWMLVIVNAVVLVILGLVIAWRYRVRR